MPTSVGILNIFVRSQQIPQAAKIVPTLVGILPDFFRSQQLLQAANFWCFWLRKCQSGIPALSHCRLNTCFHSQANQLSHKKCAEIWPTSRWLADSLPRFCWRSSCPGCNFLTLRTTRAVARTFKKGGATEMWGMLKFTKRFFPLLFVFKKGSFRIIIHT